MTKIKIKKDSKHSPFAGDDFAETGKKIDYYWTRGMVLESDIPNLAGTTIEFGGRAPHKGGGRA